MRVPLICLLFALVTTVKIDRDQNGALKKMCGENRKAKGSRISIFKIYNGKDAETGQWPWATALDLAHSKEADCTGSLISRRHILTAAHCIVDAVGANETFPCGSRLHDPKQYRAHIGTERFESTFQSGRKLALWFENSKGNADQQVYQVKHFYKHKRFTCNGKYDIAIMELEREVPKKLFDDGKVNVVCLPHEHEPVEMEMVAHGWGLTLGTFGRSKIPMMKGSDHLQWTELVFMPLAECKRRFEDAGSRQQPHDDAICIVESLTNVCMGDSGGPLLKLNRERDRFIILGVLSHGTECEHMDDEKSDEKHEERTGGVYTDVRKYLEWICKNTNVCYTIEDTSESSEESDERRLKMSHNPEELQTDELALIGNVQTKGQRVKVKKNITIQTEEILLP